MKVLSKIVVTLLCLAGAISANAEDILSPSKIIDREGELVISDGSSLYRFKRGGRFRSEPLGLSGRLIEGKWSSDKDGSFSISGKWSWLNGISQINDYREMSISISGLELKSNNLLRFPGADPEKTKLYGGYFLIHRLVSDKECKVNNVADLSPASRPKSP